MVHTASARAARSIPVLLLVLPVFALPLRLIVIAATSQSEEVEVIDLIAHANHPVLRECLINLHTGHRKSEHTSRTIFKSAGEVVLQRHIHAQQGREGLIDTHRRYIVHRGRNRITRGCFTDESKSVHIFLPRGITAIGTHGIDALVRVIDIDTLEMVTEPRQLSQTTIPHRPVGKHTENTREDVKSRRTHRIGIEEGRNQHVSTILLYCTICLVVCMARQGWPLGRLWINGIRIACLHLLMIIPDRVAEFLKRLTVIAVIGIAHAFQCRLHGDGRHRESTALHGGHACIHILHTACLGLCVGGIEVNLQVLHGFQCHTQLQILGGIGSGRC